MKWIFYIAFVYILSVPLKAYSQNPEAYQTHTVRQGETVYSIAKQYNTSELEIYRLNPDARKGVKLNTILILPSNTIKIGTDEQMQFKMHRVKRKETIFSVSQLYNVQVEEIKKYNKELYSRSLKKGERIRIPLGLKTPISEETSISIKPNTSVHTVVAKETKFGIARKYGISIAELEDLNPDLGHNLPIGKELNVPEVAVLDTSIIEEEIFEFYEVQPKEGFFRLKVKLGLSEEEIISLNPYAKNGLKEGMILKIPKEKVNNDNDFTSTINLEEFITNRTKKNIALMLPFRLNRSDNDSIEAKTELLRNDATLRIALDFYSGVLLAAEFAKDHGISVNIDVYDTEASETRVAAIIGQNDFKNVDAVIGPLLSRNVEKAASGLKQTDTPIFSPLSNKEIKISTNLFQSLPSNEMLMDKMLKYLKAHSIGKNVILISDATKSDSKQMIISNLGNIKMLSPRSEGFLYPADIMKILDENLENWIILESSDPVVVSNVVGLLNGVPEEFTLKLFTLDKNEAYDYHDVSNIHLAKLAFTFPSVNRSYNYKEKTAFLTSYQNTYGVLPNRYAVRGFDVTYDVLLRLASSDDVYDSANNQIETEYIENKFRYTKKLFSGYQNNAVYIIQYTPELQFEEVK